MMKRRHFLRNTAIAGLGVILLPSACRQTAETDLKLEEITLDTLHELLQSGKISSRQLVQAYLDRIDDIDKRGPALHAIIEINPEALAIADALDAERKAGKVRGPLHGIPVVLKDNIDTADQLHTTAGSLALEQHRAPKDAFLVARLREAGAIILAKANLSEWANFRSTRSSSGWSSRGGQTLNPYRLDRSPCGSSSGSAVAVAAGLCPVAVGTETDGSIACPASINGIVGIKPTVGLVSRSGIIPISKTQDTAGPFARTVRDAALLLNTLAAPDPNDPAARALLQQKLPDYTSELNDNALQGKRIGVDKSLLKHHEGIDAITAQALDAMRQAGATIVEVDFMGFNRESSAAEFTVLKYEFKDGLNRYLAEAKAPLPNLEAIIQFNKDHADKTMPYFRQELLEDCQKMDGLDNPEYQKALQDSHFAMQKHIDKVLTDNQLDALCGPATGAAWCIDLLNGDSWAGYGGYGPAAVAGYPSITLPMGFYQEMPVGISFMGAAWSESKLIALAYAFEQKTKQRKSPKYLRNLG